MDIYAEITEQVMTALEQGTAPWRKPWTTAGPPRNAITNRPYRGINPFLLTAAQG